MVMTGNYYFSENQLSIAGTVTQKRATEINCFDEFQEFYASTGASGARGLILQSLRWRMLILLLSAVCGREKFVAVLRLQ